MDGIGLDSVLALTAAEDAVVVAPKVEVVFVVIGCTPEEVMEGLTVIPWPMLSSLDPRRL